MISVLMISVLSEQTGEEILTSQVPTLFLVLQPYQNIGEIWQNLFLIEDGISVGNTLTVNIEEQFMEHTYLELMLLVL